MRNRITIAILAATLLSGPAAAVDLPSAMGVVSEAIERGYGVECDLTMRPSATDAYYPCIDIGPYRFVVEYGRTRGFVLVPEQDPFEILLSDTGGTRFTVQGNWVTDLPVRVEGWWQSLSSGSTQPDRAAAAGDAVAAYLKSLEPEPAPEPPQTEAPPAQQPQVFYIVPPNYGQQQPVPSPLPQATPPIPSGYAAPAGGVLLAPGVVGYPTAGSP